MFEHIEHHLAKLKDDDHDVDHLISERKLARLPASSRGGHARRHPLKPDALVMRLDHGLAILSVRDSLPEYEAAAANVLKWLAKNESLETSDVGIIIPQNSGYDHDSAETFAYAGLIACALPSMGEPRNIGGEALFHFRQCRRRPAPAMAIASLYCSPVL